MNTDDADRDPTTTPSAGGEDDPVLTAVERAVGAYLDFLEGLGPRPVFDGLADDDRADAVAVINTVLAGQGNHLESSAPPFEELLLGTEFETALRAAQSAMVSVRHDASAAATAGARSGVGRQRARMERIASALQGIDERVVIRIQPDDVVGSAVAVSYLDLRAIFFPVDIEEPIITTDIRADVEMLFADADLAYVGVVADGSAELMTQLLTPSDLEAVVVAPSNELTVPWLPVLTAAQALRRMLEAAAPTWEPYRLDIDRHGPLDLAALAARISRTVLDAETSRAYRGDKKAAYQALSGSIETFARLVQELSRPPVVDDERANAAVDSVVQEAA